MSRRAVVAEAAIDVLAARLSQEVPGLEQTEISRIARAQAGDLKRAGWRIAAPVAALPASLRRHKSSP